MAWFSCDILSQQILNMQTIGTASGSVASFSTDVTEDLINCNCQFAATQASGTPTPSAPIPITPVNSIAVTRTGKNLFNPNTAVSGYIATDGNIATAGTTTKEKTGDYVEVKDTSKYLTLSLDYGTTQEGWGGFGWYDANKNFISRNATTQSGVTKLSISRKPPENAKYFRATLRTYGNNDIQVEITETTTATAYEAYNGVTKTLALGGDYYGGEVDALSGEIKASKAKNTFDGSADENWVKTSGNYFYIAVADALSSDDRTEIQSNIIVYATTSSTVWGGYLRNGRIYVNTDGTAATVDAFKTWLSSNNMEVVYPLAASATAQASNAIELNTLLGVNNIYCDTGNTSVTYLETIKNHYGI